MLLEPRIYELEPQVKLKNSFAVNYQEGIFVDHSVLMINGNAILNFTGSMVRLNSIIDFVFHDKPYQFRFNYRWWTGKPRSFIVLQNNRVIAQYGDDSALKLKPDMRGQNP